MSRIPISIENFELTTSPKGHLASFDAEASHPVRQILEELSTHGKLSVLGDDVAVLGRSGRPMLLFPGAGRLCSDWPWSKKNSLLLCLCPSGELAPWAKSMEWIAMRND